MCFNERIKPPEHINNVFTNKYNKTDFIKMLENTPLKEFSTLLYDFCLSQKQTESDEDYIIPKDLDIKDVIELSKSIIYLMSSSSPDFTISIKSNIFKTDSATISNQIVVKNTLNALIQAYTELKLNEEHLTYVEAKDIITGNGTLDFSDIDHSSENDVSKWIRHYINTSPDVKWGLENMEEMIYLGDQFLYCSPEMIVKYATEHTITREVTVDYLNEKLAQFEIKSGAKPKNDKISSFAERLSNLIRLDEFLEQTTEADIERYRIKNTHYKLIYDVITYFELIESYENHVNTTTPVSYVKSLISNYRKNRKKQYAKRKRYYLAEMTINEFKKTNLLLPYYV